MSGLGSGELLGSWPGNPCRAMSAGARTPATGSAWARTIRSKANATNVGRDDEPPSLVARCEVITHIERGKLTAPY